MTEQPVFTMLRKFDGGGQRCAALAPDAPAVSDAVADTFFILNFERKRLRSKERSYGRETYIQIIRQSSAHRR